jgi:hypothetical protein
MRIVTAALLVPLLAIGSSAHAAHPLISEDTGTLGGGKYELELGTQLATGGGHVFELDPQLSYGVRDDVDFIVRPSLLWLSGDAADAAGRSRGFGSTALDVKWRAWSSDPLSLGTRAGLDLPTASPGLGSNGVGAHAIAVATYETPGALATANAAYTRLGDDAGGALRRDLLRVSAAFVREVRADVRLAIEAAAFSHPDPAVARWPAVVLVGAIAHLPIGVDVDVGYQAGLNRAAPASVWLAGMTLRW